MTFDTAQKKKLGIEIKPNHIAILSNKMRMALSAHLFELEVGELGLNKWGNMAT
ncbi:MULTISPECIES: hypothetical protein [Bradyrhizobium]|uniref:hypothetical protein n=1 Tax=Bradyrhizobium TaxID=374 RepID=UPI00155DF3E9|nr:MULTISPECIES: hypothetical protein [Bradyrhizobium]